MRNKYFVEYIDIDLFKCNIYDFNYTYTFIDNKEKYSVYFFKDEQPIKIEYDITKPPHYYWLSFFDYNKYSDDINFNTKLESFYSDCFDKLSLINVSGLELEKLIHNFKEYVAFHPYFLSYFKILYDLIHNRLTNSNNFDINSILSDVKKNIENIRNTYDLMKDFIYWSLIFYNAKGKSISPKLSLRMYELYLTESGKNNIFIKYLYKNRSGFVQSNLSSNPEDFMLECLLDDTYDVDNISAWEMDGDITFDQEFAYNLNFLINNDYILSKCPNCGRYFIKKYTATTTYCSNLFRNTKANCQEYSARIKYQSKLKDNPIQAEFYLVRNRMYIKVKRGSISKNEAKLEDLRKLRDKYLDLYKNCLEKDNEKIITDFKEAIILLYKEN